MADSFARPVLMSIHFRYLFVRIMVPFAVCLFAGTVIWVMADLYGNLYDFMEHKVGFFTVVWFYMLQLPTMLVQVLPAAMLFSSLWALLALNRRSELVALQSGGIAPVRIFVPFFLFAGLWAIILGIDLYGPASEAKVARDRLLKQVKGGDARGSVFENFPYVDNVNHRVWYFQKLDVGHNHGKGMELLLRDTQGNDMQKYFARDAEWNGEFWQLSGVREIIYGTTDTVKDFPQLDLPDVTTPPKQLSLVMSDADELTVPELSQYISTSTSSKENLARFRTEWWYRILQPLSLMVLLLFALLNGIHFDRRGAATGVAWTIGVLILYTISTATFLPFGKFNRMSPFMAVIATELIFGLIGLHLLSVKYGWYWNLGEYWRRWSSKPGKPSAR